MTNQSVEAFKRRLAFVPDAIRSRVRAELLRQAETLAGAMRAAAPKRSGHLAASIRIDESGLDNRDVMSVSILAGGELTTREVRQGSGVAYDYARATEFGTQKERAEPFFFSTYRAMKRRIRSAIAKAMTTLPRRGGL